MNFTILRFDSIDSTNLEALRQARLGADEGLCIVARQQTAGRGRQGRAWSSPRDGGSYFSIVLRPTLDSKHLALITLAAAVAAHEALTELGLRPDIKWPNDILVNEKKLCGILAETAETPSGLAVVVGIGVNLTSKCFPDHLADSATSIEAEIKSTRTVTLEGSLMKHFGYFYTRLIDQGSAEMLQEWQRRSTYSNGKLVRATLQNAIIEGITDGLEDNGALRVKMADGEVVSVHAGDVERLLSAC
jgi:BirA family biotin operon repressor/biotin-[acetyl-CoA-carboxylase] ligase